jgi:GNAT superfamily N-acetyltransferase
MNHHAAAATPVVREVRPDDDLVALTALIREAYAPLAALGLRYWATHQSPEDTAKRFSRGIGLVATIDELPIATIALSRPDPDSKVLLLREPLTWSFGQFAVAPSHKGKGYGKLIHDHAVNTAHGLGCQVMALHTAQPALHLIQMYSAWGYTQVGTCDWRPRTNYLSVLMTQRLTKPSAAENAS